ncbi:hypothetical protein HRbin23_00800 [bacterium HR23]|nr:hypothetical protein HRbin23_00800 [bacterium HR23]
MHHRQGVPLRREEAVIRLLQGKGQGTGLHWASVHDDTDDPPMGAVQVGGADETLYLQPPLRPLGLEGEEGLGHLGAIHRSHRLPQVARPRCGQHLFPVHLHEEAHRGEGQGIGTDHLLAAGGFGRGGAEELAPSGEVAEEAPHRNGGAGASAGRLPTEHCPLPHLHQGALLLLPMAGEEAHPGDAGDAVEGLPPKAQGGDGREVGFRGEFAGGVALEEEGHVPLGDAHPVVRDPNALQPPAHHLHRHVGGAGVQGVLHQFLHHRSGALHHLPGGDAGRDLWGEDADRHGAPRWRGGGRPGRGCGRWWTGRR